VDWKKIRPIGQIVESFLQVRSLLTDDLSETVADSDSLRVAWPVLSLRGAEDEFSECVKYRERKQRRR
jgi:hypothetical protein